MKKYCKELDVYFVSEEETTKGAGCLWQLAGLVLFALVLYFACGSSWCRRHPEECYCNSLNIATEQERPKLLREIQERGYDCSKYF